MAGKNSKTSHINLLRHTNLKVDLALVDRTFMALHGNREEILRTLEPDDRDGSILSELWRFPELDGYWAETLLSHLSLHFPESTCAFFLERLEMATETNESFSRIRPINYGPWVHVPLQFKSSQQYPAVLEHVWKQIVKHDPSDWRFEHHAASIFEGMFLPIDNAVMSFLADKLATASKQGYLVDRSSNFRTRTRASSLNVQTFVVNFLDACESAGAERLGVRELIH